MWFIIGCEHTEYHRTERNAMKSCEGCVGGQSQIHTHSKRDASQADLRTQNHIVLLMTQITKATEGRTLAMTVLIDLAPEGCPQVSCPQQLLFISLQLCRSGAAALQHWLGSAGECDDLSGWRTTFSHLESGSRPGGSIPALCLLSVPISCFFPPCYLN